jgi:hypothetical protein
MPKSAGGRPTAVRHTNIGNGLACRVQPHYVMYVTLQVEVRMRGIVDRVRRTWLTPLTVGFAVGTAIFLTTTPI